MNNTLTTRFKRYLPQPEAIILLLVFIVTAIIFKTMGSMLAPIFVSVIFAYLLFSIVKKLQEWHCPRLLAISLVFLLFLSLSLLIFLYLLPLLWEETISLISEIPLALNHGQMLLYGLHDQFPDLISVKQLHQIITYITIYFADLGKEIVTFSLTSLFGVITVIAYFVLVPLLVFFFLRDGKVIIQWLLGFLPAKKNVLKNVWYEVYETISSYIRGKSIEILLVGFVTTAAFWILGLHHAVLLGALVGLSVLIPYFGIAVVTIPIVVVGLIQWGWSEHFLYLISVYALIVILDANILVPILFAEVMNLHPLAIILGVLFFGSFWGFWGVFFAIPLIALINILIKTWPLKTTDK